MVSGMYMSWLEKKFVNRKKKAQRNTEKVRRSLNKMEIKTVHNVLEIGCGIGKVSAFLAETYGMDVYGTDFDPQEIELAKTWQSEHEKLHFVVEDATALSFEDNTFDLVISQNVFHHIPKWQMALTEIVRVLRHEGYLFWCDLAFPRTVIRILQPIIKNYGLYTFENVRTAFTRCGLYALHHKRLAYGIFFHHDTVFRKVC
jgi:ubiquinone/menaquinone biosynthesis C-methylase UbiE